MIHVEATQNRKKSRLDRYSQAKGGEEHRGALTDNISGLETETAIITRVKRKDTGGDGITAEIFTRNCAWLAPLLTYVIHADAETDRYPPHG